jgi:hypothetical protein
MGHVWVEQDARPLPVVTSATIAPFPLTDLGWDRLSSGFNRVKDVFSVLQHRPRPAGSGCPPENHA